MRIFPDTSQNWSFSSEDSTRSLASQSIGAVGEFWLWLKLAPSFVKALFFTLSMFLILEGAHLSSTGQLLYRQVLSGPSYGPPAPSKDWHTPKSFSFSQVGRSYNGNLQLWRFDELSTDQLKSIFLKSTPMRLKKGLNTYVNVALRYSEAFQVDPLWVLSIMWVESHFEPTAISQVMAQGLMQIMPSTSHYLNKLMDRSIEPRLARELTKDPHHNVELGVFYLKRLLKRFNNNYVHATVAYNMGPGYTKRRLQWGLPVGTKNIYLDKVNRAYRRLSRGIIKHFKQNAALYVSTYVVKRRWLNEWQEIQLFTWWEEEVGGDNLGQTPPFMSQSASNL
jgi:soluble lytic murein transglycosylase